METATSLGFFVAFSAGLLSFLSPCVLPLIPSYLSFITGLSLEEMGQKRHLAVIHSLLFVSGFSLIFMGLGAAATGVGQVLNSQQVWLERVGGVLIILFGFYLMGAFNIAIFARERRFHIQDKPLGYLGSVLVGIAFGAGWTPCIGPILGAILTFSASQADMTRGLTLLSFYSLGLAVPFIAAAVAADRFVSWFQKYKRFMPVATKLSGAVLVAVGVLLLSGYFTLLANFLNDLTPEFIRSRI